MSYTPLWSTIVLSSLWDEPDVVCKVFITMLAVRDYDHVVRLSAYNLARAARKEEWEVLAALKVLAAPDTKRREKQKYDGRRIEKVSDGWLILNGEFYQEMMRKANRRSYKRQWQREHRQKEKAGPTGRETRYVKAHEAGDEAKADSIAAEGLNQ